MNTEPKKERTWQEDLQQFVPEPQVAVAAVVLAVCFSWFYWKVGSFGVLTRVWTQADYQHGPFVPLFSLFLLWYRRDMIIPFAGRGSLWGLPFLALWALMRWAAVYFNFESLPEYSMLPFFAGVALFVGGWQALRWAWPAIFFLIFMLRLPGDVQGWLSVLLQGIATKISVFIVQTLGIPSMADGHRIELTDGRKLNVEEACSGLRMMMLFFALCVGTALLVKKPLWERLLIVVSAIPFAVLGNVMRIVATAIGSEIVHRYFTTMDPSKVVDTIHTWAGYLIEMPVGLLLLWIELTLLSKLLISPLPERPLLMGEMLDGRTPAPAAVPPTTRREK
jgi:exosortase